MPKRSLPRPLSAPYRYTSSQRSRANAMTCIHKTRVGRRTTEIPLLPPPPLLLLLLLG